MWIESEKAQKRRKDIPTGQCVGKKGRYMKEITNREGGQALQKRRTDPD